MVAGIAFWSILPVVILKAINFSDFSLSKCLLSNLLFACGTGKTSNMVCSLQCTDHIICNGITTSPTKFQAGLVAVCAQRDSCFVVVLFPSQGTVARPTLEAAIVVRPVQGLYCRFRKSHGFPTEATHLFVHAVCILAILMNPV